MFNNLLGILRDEVIERRKYSVCILYYLKLGYCFCVMLNDFFLIFFKDRFFKCCMYIFLFIVRGDDI